MRVRRLSGLTLLLGMTMLGAAAPTAAAARPANDHFADWTLLDLGIPQTAVTNEATYETGETNTPAGYEPEGTEACYHADGSSTQVDRTVWWGVVGTGRPVTVSTAGSTFDTVLSVFEGSVNQLDPPCSDSDDPRAPESLTFDTRHGVVYRIQVGGCLNYAGPDGNLRPNACGLVAGTAKVVATSPPPPNDNRAAAAPLPTGVITVGDNHGATEEGGEPQECVSLRGRSLFGRSVWYRWTAPARGKAVFTASAVGFDTVLAVYAGGAEGYLQCDDDPSAPGPARVEVDVTPGDYFVQVGGWGRHGTEPGVDSEQGHFNVQAEFAQNPDRDGDGDVDSSDCAPDNPFVHHGDVVDKPRDGVDQDCVNGDAKWPILGAKVERVFARYRRYVKLTGLKATGVDRQARIEVSCGSRRRGCPYRKARTLPALKRGGTVLLLDRRLKRARLRRGLTVRVKITTPGYVSVVHILKLERLQSGKLGFRKSRRCINPLERRSRPCEQAG